MSWQFAIVMRGYSRREVDQLLARVESGQATPAEILEARFGKQMRGYAPREVDAALTEIRAGLPQ